jgi:predicted RNA-binding Zn-ribbon protein involved in translation (DUF1610 family)
MPRPTPSRKTYASQRRTRSTAESGAVKFQCPTCGAAMGQGCKRRGGICEERGVLAARRKVT